MPAYAYASEHGRSLGLHQGPGAHLSPVNSARTDYPAAEVAFLGVKTCNPCYIVLAIPTIPSYLETKLTEHLMTITTQHETKNSIQLIFSAL